MSRYRGYFITVTMMLLLAGLPLAWWLSPSLRTTLRWPFLSRRYKRQVAALPLPPNGYLQHIVWDRWGFAGIETDVYLVFDPSNRLAAAAASGKPGTFPGLPCEVYNVREIDWGWYIAWFYTDTDWEHCPKAGRSTSVERRSDGRLTSA